MNLLIPERVAIWWPKLVPEIAARYYKYMTTAQLGEKYDKTPEAMRQWLHREGIEDPKRLAVLKTRAQIVRFRLDFGWSIADISEQVEKPARYVRKVLVAVLGRIKQLALWMDSEFRIPAPPMRIVHSAKRQSVTICNQLELFTNELKSIAA